MKIKYVTTSFPKFSGDSHAPWILQIAKSLVNKGHEVEVIAPSAKDLNTYDEIDKVKVNRFRYNVKFLEVVAYGANIPANVSSSLKAKFSLPFFIIGFFIACTRKLSNCDIIHAQFGYSGVFAIASQILKFRKIPVIVSFYGRDIAHSKKHKLIYKYLFRRVSRIIVISEDMRNELVANGCDINKISIVHLGVKFNEISNTKSYLVKEKVKLLTIANFIGKKGIEDSLNAVHALLKKGINIDYKIVGHGPLKQVYLEMIDNMNAKENIEVIDNYEKENPREYVFNLFTNADIFILTSTTTKGDYGGTPIVLMEAGAYGLPCITTNNAGNCEIVQNNKTGIIVKENDIEDISQSIEKLVKDYELRINMGTCAKDYIKKHFNQELLTKNLVDLYKTNMLCVE